MITRYVRMDSTPGGNGTTDTTAGANRAYASLADAMAAFHNTDPGDAVTVYVRRGAGGVDTTGINQPNVVTTALRPFRVEAYVDDFATATWDNAKYTLQVTNAHCFYNNIIDYLEISGLQVHLIESDGGGWEAVKLTNANQHVTDVYNLIERSFVRCTRTTGSTIGIDLGGIDAQTRLGIARNCVVRGFRTGVLGVGALSKTVNCTLALNQFSLVEDAAPMVAMNVISTGCTGVDYAGAGAAACTNNADDSGNGMPGANARIGVTFSFEDAAGLNYHLLVTDTGAKGFGATNPLSGQTGEFVNDMDGGIRVAPWDIGADQYGALPPGGATGPMLLLLGV